MATTVRLLNNSGQAIVITYKPMGDDVRRDSVASGEAIEITGWDYGHYANITAGSTRWCYSLPSAPVRAYDVSVGWWLFARTIIKARLEPDGHIVLLKPDQQITDTALEQPRGYPLTPGSECRI
jgi:hypothetical protein